MAECEGVSLNQLIVTSLAEKIGEYAKPYQLFFNTAISYLNTPNLVLYPEGAFIVDHRGSTSTASGSIAPLVPMQRLVSHA